MNDLCSRSAKWIRPMGAACFLMLISMNPASALQAAAQSLNAWLNSVAPSLLPFLIVMPALTCEETCALLSRVSGGFLRFFRLPKNAAGAILIGLLSGSPAGAAALTNVKPEKDDPDGAFVRAAWMASGASSAFLLSGIAVGMLNMPEVGIVLLRSQLGAVLLGALLLRPVGRGTAAFPAHAPRPQQSGVLSAMMTLLSIGGYMALFSVLARQISQIISPELETPLLALMEMSGGCQSLAIFDAPLHLKLPLISAAACFGGISVCAQCLSFLKPLGIHPVEYAAGKLVQAALAAVLTYMQLAFLPIDLKNVLCALERIDPAMASMLAVSCMVLIVMILAFISRRKIGE